MSTKTDSAEADGRASRSSLTGTASLMGPVAHMSMVERVSRALRQAVLRGHLRPGQNFSISQLCAELGVSHIPVREALRRLESQGLVELRPGRSGVVTPINIEDLCEIYMLRAAIETELIGRAAPHYSDDDLEVLHEALLAMELESSDPQGDDFWLWHNKFHWQLLEPAALAWSARVLGPLWHAAERYIRLFFVENTDLISAMKEHRDMYDAASRRSGADLTELLRVHLDENLELLKQCVVEMETRYSN